jgi:hypothetical protein
MWIVQKTQSILLVRHALTIFLEQPQFRLLLHPRKRVVWTSIIDSFYGRGATRKEEEQRLDRLQKAREPLQMLAPQKMWLFY